MKRLGEKKQRVVAGHQGCSTCQPETKGGKALERRRSEREIVEQIEAWRDALTYDGEGFARIHRDAITHFIIDAIRAEKPREVCAAKHARSKETCVLAPHSHPVHVGDYSGEGDLFTFTDARHLRGVNPDVERIFGNREGVSDEVRAIFTATTPLDVTSELKKVRSELSGTRGEVGRRVRAMIDIALGEKERSE